MHFVLLLYLWPWPSPCDLQVQCWPWPACDLHGWWPWYDWRSRSKNRNMWEIMDYCLQNQVFIHKYCLLLYCINVLDLECPSDLDLECSSVCEWWILPSVVLLWWWHCKWLKVKVMHSINMSSIMNYNIEHFSTHIMALTLTLILWPSSKIMTLTL